MNYNEFSRVVYDLPVLAKLLLGKIGTTSDQCCYANSHDSDWDDSDKSWVGRCSAGKDLKAAYNKRVNITSPL